MASCERSEATRILSRVTEGDSRAVDQLIPIVYDQLRRLAGDYLRRERSDHTLQSTALVHEAYVRLVDRTRIAWNGRTHFVAIAAREMRRILIQHARGRGAVKRGRGWARISLEGLTNSGEEKFTDVLALEEALQRLSSLDGRKGRIIELRFFGGLTVEEAAEVLGVSPKTVEKDWRMARAWLLSQLQTGS